MFVSQNIHLSGPSSQFVSSGRRTRNQKRAQSEDAIVTVLVVKNT
jgi:hypothetical protein